MALTYVLVLAMLLASALCGQATLRIVQGRAWTWTAPATGFALLLAVATATIRLPGHGITTAAALGAVVLGSAALVRLHGLLRLLPAAPSVIAILSFVSLP